MNTTTTWKFEIGDRVQLKLHEGYDDNYGIGTIEAVYTTIGKVRWANGDWSWYPLFQLALTLD